MSVVAVVFDMDGVLVDSEPVWERVRRAYVADRGGQWKDDTQRRLMGMSTKEWSEYLSGELGVDASPETVAREVIEQMAAHYDRELPLLPGAVAAVRRISARWPLAVASSSPRALIDVVLRDADLVDSFTVTLSTEEVQHGKPSPEVYLAAAEALGHGPESCAAVEDSSNGIRAAHGAGLLVIGIPSSDYPLDSDAATMVTHTITSLDQLTPELIEG
ncbi:HAD family hydrolase [Nocardia callitridis]|uniref:HAD family phosphatase n=1 Tax=Nocardia callitridis TaxID=648753 RepID=A0ABP9KMR7_9NOCA